MSNHDANGDGTSQTYTYYTVPVTGTTSGFISYPTSATFNPPQTYTLFWGDDRKSIPHLCRCNTSMSEPHEDHIYIKKKWFCSIKCYQEFLVACIGENIDEG